MPLKGWKDINPMTTPDGTDANKGAYQYVLFGKYASTPIVWRILSADQLGTERKGYLYSEKALGGDRQFHSSLNNNYGTSDIQAYLVGTTGSGFYVNSNFTDKEKRAVVVQSFTTAKGDGSGSMLSSGNAMFLPSYDELKVPAYGFFNSENPDVNRKAFDISGVSVWYWTRSPFAGSTFRAWFVYVDGLLDLVLVYNPGVAVRPACFLNLESLIFKSASNDFGLSTPAQPPTGGQISNPYVLVIKDNPVSLDLENVSFVSADHKPAASIDGKVLTLSWNSAISPAVKRWPASGDFTLSVDGAEQHPTIVSGDGTDPKLLNLTFAQGVTANAIVTLSYNLNTDAISCDYDVPSTTASVVDSFTKNVVNVTPGGGGGGGETTLSNETTPKSVDVTLGGNAYSAQTQPDGTYLITLPSGTDLKAIKINMTLPKGATISPGLSSPFNFASENPKKFTITAEDGTTKKVITIQIIVPVDPPTEKAVLTATASDCAVIYTLNKDGTIAVEIRIPFISGITPADLESLMLALKNSGLSGIKFAYVNADGTIVPYSSDRRTAATRAPYLQITGNAPSVASLANEAVTSLSYKTKGSTTQYIQTFPDGGLKLSAMDVTDNTKKESGSSSSGCNAGFGSAVLFAMGIVVLGLNKAGARKKK